MPAAMLDTLRCAQTLEAAGVPQPQAEGIAQVLGDALADVATKDDLAATREDMAATRKDVAATREDVATTRNDLAATREDVAALRRDLTATRKDLEAAIAGLDERLTSGIKGLERQMNFLFGFLGLIFAMITAYGIFDITSTAPAVAAPVQAEAHPTAPQAETHQGHFQQAPTPSPGNATHTPAGPPPENSDATLLNSSRNAPSQPQ